MHSIIHTAGRLKGFILRDPLLMAGLGIMATALFLMIVGLLWVKLRSKNKKQVSSEQQNEGKENIEELQKTDEVQRPRDEVDEYYQPIIERVRKAKKKYKSILFAAWDLESLPVTIPVNVVLELAKNQTRCLLIDLDMRRDAIARVFNIEDRPELQVKASRTELDNLWIWPAHNFTKLRQMNIKLLVQKALEKFDLVIINSPYLASSPDRNQILSSAQAAVVFSSDTTKATELAKLIKASKCVVISKIQSEEVKSKAAGA
jgi:Mrp family chromosome partitioning ATPase